MTPIPQPLARTGARGGDSCFRAESRLAFAGVSASFWTATHESRTVLGRPRPALGGLSDEGKAVFTPFYSIRESHVRNFTTPGCEKSSGEKNFQDQLFVCSPLR